MNRQSPNNNHRVRWHEPLRWKNALNQGYKNNNGRNFQFTKFSFIDLSLQIEEVFQVNGQNRLVTNLPVVDFHSQPKEMLTREPLNNLRYFPKYIGFLPLLGTLEPHCLSAIRIF